MNAALKLRNLALDLLGVAVLVLKRHYGGLGEELVHAYAGNASVSFALYFVAMLSMPQSARGRTAAVIVTAAAVTLFEITNGFGVMANVYDPWDLVANAAGLGLALAVDLITARWMSRLRRAGSATV